MTYTFKPQGVCAKEMLVEVDEQGVLRELQVKGGCHGNLQGISALVKDMNKALNGRGGGRNGFAQGSVQCGRTEIEAFFRKE